MQIVMNQSRIAFRPAPDGNTLIMLVMDPQGNEVVIPMNEQLQAELAQVLKGAQSGIVVPSVKVPSVVGPRGM